MKIVHIIGGAEQGGSRVHVLNLIKGLAARNRNLDLELVCLLDSVVAKEGRDRGISVTVFPMRHRFDLSVIPTIRRYLKQRFPTIIHTHGIRANFIGRLASRKLDVKVVTTVHSSVYSDYVSLLKRRLYPWIEKLTRRWTDHFIVAASSLGSELVADGVQQDRISLVYNAAPEAGTGGFNSSVDLRQKIGVDYDIPLVLAVGRLEAVKHPDYLLQVFSALKARRSFHAVLVGEGSLRPQLERRVQDEGLAGFVTFLGFRDDVPSLLDQADIFVSTSRMEGTPIALLEAMRAGLPVVANDIGGIAEIVRLAKNGCLIPRGDLKKFVDALDLLLSDKTLRDTLGRSGTDSLSRYFSENEFLAKTVEVYEAVTHHLSSSHRRVTISGYYGAGNIGDEAILKGLVSTLREEGIEDITVLSFHPPVTEHLHKVKALYIGKRYSGLFPIYRHLRHTDLFVLGGGGLLHDSTGRVLPFWMSRVLLAKAAGTPVVFLAIGAGPLQLRLSRWLVPLVSHLAERITVRDEHSRLLLAAIGVPRPRIELMADLALCMDLEQSDTEAVGIDGLSLKPGSPLVAVCLRGWQPPSGFEPALVECLRSLQEKCRLRYLMIPFHKREDQEITKKVGYALETRACDGATWMPAGRPEEVASILSKVNAVITMRLHGAVLASLSYVPAFGLVGEEKVEQYIERSVGSPDVVELAELIERHDEVVQKIISWIGQWEAKRAHLQSNVPLMRQDARRNVAVVAEVLRRTAVR